MDVRGVLEGLEGEEADAAAALSYLAVQDVELGDDELRGVLRRALLLLASGGDPRRELDPDSRAVAVVAAELDSPARRAALRRALEGLRGGADGLPGVSAALDRLLADDELAWRSAACALLAEELAA